MPFYMNGFTMNGFTRPVEVCPSASAVLPAGLADYRDGIGVLEACDWEDQSMTICERKQCAAR